MAGPGWSQDARDPAYMAPLASSNALILDAVSIDGHIVAVGERGVILTATMPVTAGSRANVPSPGGTEPRPTSMTEIVGWVVGHDSIVLKTTDGGDNWTVTKLAPELEQPLFDVWLDASNGMAVGAYGAMIVSDDGGDTWQKRACWKRWSSAPPAEAADGDEVSDRMTHSGKMRTCRPTSISM